MSYSYVVLAWKDVDGRYQDVQVYAGESMLNALWAMHKAKKDCGFVTLKWRG
jgi:hypothetical protein